MRDTAFENCDDLKILALCIYGEARGEGIEGMLAVASVVANRAKMSKRTIKEICLQPYQFSCFNTKDPNRAPLLTVAKEWDDRIKTDRHLRQSYWVAKGVLEGWLMSNVGNATHYHHVSVKPAWADKMQEVVRIGKHQFYFEKDWRGIKDVANNTKGNSAII